MRNRLFAAAAAVCLASSGQARAWGNVGHQVTAIIAYDRLTPKAKAQVDTLLAADADTLTSSDFPARATWADVYRNSHRETSEWHFADIELDHPDLDQACGGFPVLQPGQLASQGGPKDCVVSKIAQFTTELGDHSLSQSERIVALKFLIHFIGDVHQPLHASDHNDRGANCVLLAPSADFKSANLHSYWDTGVVLTLGASPAEIARRLEGQITAAKVKAWSRGDAKSWARQSFGVAKSVVYRLPARPTCDDHTPITLSQAYEAAAHEAAAAQLEKAGVRMAWVLNRALR